MAHRPSVRSICGKQRNASPQLCLAESIKGGTSNFKYAVFLRALEGTPAQGAADDKGLRLPSSVLL